MNNLDRRTFLAGMAAATPFVFGLGSLFGQDEKAPEFFKDALKKMKATGRPGVVIIAPAQEWIGKLIGAHLLGLIDGADAGPHELFTGAVWICLTPATAKRSLADLPEGKNRLLLDSEGKRLEADTIQPGVFQTKDAFVESFTKFIYGADQKRLEAWAAKVELTVEDKAALKNLESESIEIRDAAESEVAKGIDRLHPALVQMRNRAAEEAKGRLGAILERSFQNAPAAEPGPRLPYGTERVKEEVDSCPTCGMMARPPKVNSFLKFMTK